MIQAMDIDGALKVYRSEALNENVICVREYTPQPQASEDDIWEILDDYSRNNEHGSDFILQEDFTIVAKAIADLYKEGEKESPGIAAEKYIHSLSKPFIPSTPEEKG